MRSKFDLITIGLLLLMVLAFVFYVFFDLIAESFWFGKYLKNEFLLVLAIVLAFFLLMIRIVWKVAVFESRISSVFDDKDKEGAYNTKMDIKDATINNLIKIQDKHMININSKLDNISELITKIAQE